MILDYRCFLNDNVSISLPKLNSEEQNELFNLDVNFPVHFFMQLKATEQEILTCKDDERIIQLLKNIAVEILNLDKSKTVTLQDINLYFDDFHMLKKLYLIMLNYSKGIENNEIFTLPNIQVKREGVSNYYEDMINYNDIEYMEGITVVMQHTANSFNDVMKMPYMCYLAILKQVRLNNLLQDEEWSKEYIQWKYKVEYKKNKENIIGSIKELPKSSMDDISRFASSL